MINVFLLNDVPAEVGRWFDELHVRRRRVEVHYELIEEVVGKAVLRVLGGAPLISPMVLVDPNQVVTLVLHVLEELLAPLPVLLLLLVRQQIVGNQCGVDGRRRVPCLVEPPVESVIVKGAFLIM